ncbi:Arylsulfatase [Rubripirellula tenax]|uniref:Arylsulfatase n=1 Tax=Rubripirellula tenax TaxID=2528015 RepID=A0A5C6EUJ0_9BACT|nr:sulfatase-like hydrolase/transferase [Rubripirellula tenax]TWU51001.1 Arylsulfatase [Rubripirellula tenax]
MKTTALNFRTVLLVGIVFIFATRFVSGENPSSANQPNIVLIFCDDLGYADVGFNAALFGVDTDVVTPAIDKVARAGTIFKQAYVAHPFCGPSRMGLLSGRMPHCYGGQKNLPDVAKNLEDYNSKGIPESETLISNVLRDAGYATGCIGKWHMGSSKPSHPNTRGFDEFFGFVGGGHIYFPSVTDKVEPKINDYQYFLERNGETYRSPEDAYLTDMLSDEAVQFVSANAAKQKPFFLYLAYNAPHSPLQGKTEDLQHLYPDHKPLDPGNGVDYRDYDKRQNYVAMMYAVDRGVAKLVDALNDPNADSDTVDSIMDNTLIVFLSDNGGKIAQGAINAPLQDDKGSAHEGGIRVPMFMHWPTKVPAATVFDHPVHALDLYPTFAALSGASVPADKVLDGKNIWYDFLVGKDAHADDTMYWLRHHGGGNEVAIRRGNLKAYRKNFAVWKVFDVTADVDESDNIASSNRETLDRMISDGLEWSKTLQDPQWHDTDTGRQSWIDNKMPRYSETFQSR